MSEIAIFRQTSSYPTLKGAGRECFISFGDTKVRSQLI
jgi:hypothetical protein